MTKNSTNIDKKITMWHVQKNSAKVSEGITVVIETGRALKEIADAIVETEKVIAIIYCRTPGLTGNKIG